MSNKFTLKCGNCGSEVELEGYHVNGSIVRLELDIDEETPEDSELKINCDKCGNYFYFS
ncbi:hypothetical protein [Paenibacillus dendritiformis]|uniref:hypothetical protein n=1 Tax=Paenibacillus dendritiformis TaxID=130049 RepID=UPI001300C637|nr:hypothetical protein [Paenibacillus dendritiformis]CAH8772245.1 hypothetical protein H7S4_004984 [Paenibacillus dendritiformis]